MHCARQALRDTERMAADKKSSLHALAGGNSCQRERVCFIDNLLVSNPLYHRDHLVDRPRAMGATQSGWQPTKKSSLHALAGGWSCWNPSSLTPNELMIPMCTCAGGMSSLHALAGGVVSLKVFSKSACTKVDSCTNSSSFLHISQSKGYVVGFVGGWTSAKRL